MREIPLLDREIETDPDKITNAVIDHNDVTAHLHLKFWEPIKCCGGYVYFGWYYEHTFILIDGRRSTTSLQTPEQMRNKGLY